MKVRAKALSKFGKTALAKVPMAMLEDVLVPVYLFTATKLRPRLK
jgi:hypothetical protein